MLRQGDPTAPGFRVVRRGYPPAEVDRALAELRAQVAALTADRDQLTVRYRLLADRLAAEIRRTADLDERAQRLSASPAGADGLGERVRLILQLASEEADAIVAQAGGLLAQARAAQQDLDRRRARVEAECRQLLAAVLAEAARLRHRSGE